MGRLPVVATVYPPTSSNISAIMTPLFSTTAEIYCYRVTRKFRSNVYYATLTSNNTNIYTTYRRKANSSPTLGAKMCGEPGLLVVYVDLYASASGRPSQLPALIHLSILWGPDLISIVLVFPLHPRLPSYNETTLYEETRIRHLT